MNFFFPKIIWIASLYHWITQKMMQSSIDTNTYLCLKIDYSRPVLLIFHFQIDLSWAILRKRRSLLPARGIGEYAWSDTLRNYNRQICHRSSWGKRVTSIEMLLNTIINSDLFHQIMNVAREWEKIIDPYKIWFCGSLFIEMDIIILFSLLQI